MSSSHPPRLSGKERVILELLAGDESGLARLEEDKFRAHLATFAGYRPTWAVQAFKDPHDSVRESLRRIRDSPFLLHNDMVRGFIFDVNTGLLEEVFVDEAVPTGQLAPVATPAPADSAAKVDAGSAVVDGSPVGVGSAAADGGDTAS